MDYTVSGSVIAALVGELLFVVVLPIALLIRWYKQHRLSLTAPLVGMVIFLVFAQMLEQILHYAFLVSDNAVSRVLWEQPWLYAIYGGLAAGLFEETGRYMGFKHLLKRHRNRQVAIGYGLGHGGYECLALVGTSVLSYLVLALFMNGDMLPIVLETLPEADVALVDEVFAQIAALTPSACLWAGIERVAAMILHVSLSVLVFASVHQPETRGQLYLVSIGLHALANVPAGLYQSGLLAGPRGMVAAELLILAVSLGVAWYARRIWRTLPEQMPTETPAE